MSGAIASAVSYRKWSESIEMQLGLVRQCGSTLF